MSADFDTRAIDKLIKALGKSYVARVGILGENGVRAGQKTNAEIGKWHEFGDDRMPQRSFLRVPIADKFQTYLKKSGAFDKDSIAKIVSEATLKAFVTKIGILGEQIVLEAFATRGFGKWKPSNMKYKKNQQTLIETSQLVRSISSDVVEEK